MTTYVIQYKDEVSGEWTNYKGNNTEVPSVEFLHRMDAISIAIDLRDNHAKLPKAATKWRLMDSKGKIHHVS